MLLTTASAHGAGAVLRLHLSLFYIYFLSLCLKVVCADGQHPNTMLLTTASVHGACAVSHLHLSLSHLFPFPVFEGGVCGWAAPKYHAALYSQRARSRCRFAPTSLSNIYFRSLCLKVVCAEGQRPTMLLTTASVHGACAVSHLLLFTAIPCVCRWCVRRVSAPPCCSPQPACTAAQVGGLLCLQRAGYLAL